MRLFLAMALAPLSGCVIGRGYLEHPLDETRIGTIQRGVTTKEEILQTFGPPQQVDARELVALGLPLGSLLVNGPRDKPAPERLVSARYFRYSFYRANVFGTILLVFNYVDVDVKADTLLVFFDGDDKVQDFAFAKDTDLLPRFGGLSR
jgi:hypothetical protein